MGREFRHAVSSGGIVSCSGWLLQRWDQGNDWPSLSDKYIVIQDWKLNYNKEIDLDESGKIA